MILAVLLLPVLAPASHAAPTELARQFAACTGRLSAQMEFQWLLNEAGSEQTEAERDAMISLLDAVVPSDERKTSLALRIEAKHAHSVLLTRAHFNDDGTDAAWAADRAALEIGRCRAMILS